MADIHQIISLGLGTPGDVSHFVLVGLSPNASAVNAIATPDGVEATASVGTATATGGALVEVVGVEATASVGTASAAGTVAGGGSHWVGYEPRDLYAPRWVPRDRVPEVPVHARATPQGVEARTRVGFALAIGTIGVQHGRARPRAIPMLRSAVGRVTVHGSASAVVRRVDDEEDALLWILAAAA